MRHQTPANRYFCEPRCVVAVIAPWNFPLAIVTGMTSAALVTGNTVVLKPAPQTPVVAAKRVGAFQRAGLLLAMLADQAACIRDRSHQRTITEANARQSLTMAVEAARLAHVE